MATLYVLQGPDKGRSFKTANEPAILGRENDQIPLTDRTISRHHAELRPEDGTWILRDLNSANGTLVNGVRVDKPIRLKHGDQIKIGSTLIVYGGEESVEKYSGAHIPRDLVDLDASSKNLDSAILSSIAASDESIIIAAPEMAQAAKAWNVMYELSEVIGAIISPEQLLERVMDIIFEQVQVDRAFILMREPPSDDLIPTVVRYRHQPRGGAERITTSRRIINMVVHRREGVLCTNAMTDSRFASEQKSDSIHDFGLVSVVCAPILVRDDLLGVIHIDCSMSKHTYNQEQLRLITAIGHMTGLAIQNARLVQSRMQTAKLAAVGETVAYLSHSIKNILQGLRSGADVVQMGIQRQQMPMIGQGWQIVERNLDKVLHLATNMLAFSKPREPRLERVQLNPIVMDAVALAHRKADEKSVILLTDLEEPFPPMPIDVDGIHQLVLNLAINAVDAVPENDGIVNVETRFDGEHGWATITVTDNGPGIPPEMVNKVFEPFHSSKGQGGTGLGLAVAHKIVEEHRGRLTVERPPDGGTCFRVVLPVAADRELESDQTFGPPK
ncbi:MAG: FHA domain-containing protein [Phycisphaerae bacterium]|nr:FHA domain-containing protein [Phycisphaerae bacterium]